MHSDLVVPQVQLTEIASTLQRQEAHYWDEELVLDGVPTEGAVVNIKMARAIVLLDQKDLD